MRRFWQVILIVLMFGAVACGKKAKRADVEPVEQTDKAGDPVDLGAVDSKALGDAPCGNPDWSQPPPGTIPSTP